MNIYIASDHAGFEMKNKIFVYLKKVFPQHTLIDVGCYTTDSCDYPDYAKLLCQSIQPGDMGILGTCFSVFSIL